MTLTPAILAKARSSGHATIDSTSSDPESWSFSKDRDTRIGQVREDIDRQRLEHIDSEHRYYHIENKYDSPILERELDKFG